MLPVGAIIVGVIALLLGGYSAITLSKVNKTVAEQEAKLAKIDAVEAAVNQSAAASDRLSKQYNDLRSSASSRSRSRSSRKRRRSPSRPRPPARRAPTAKRVRSRPSPVPASTSSSPATAA
jgi:uncharacterized membrane-anchored protein YhcB (DUF1043 family)